MCSSIFNVGRTLISRLSKSIRPALSLRAGATLATLGGESWKSSDILDSNECDRDSGISGLKESAFQKTVHARLSLMRISTNVGIVTNEATYLFSCSKCPPWKVLDPTDEFSDGFVCLSLMHHKLD